MHLKELVGKRDVFVAIVVLIGVIVFLNRSSCSSGPDQTAQPTTAEYTEENWWSVLKFSPEDKSLWTSAGFLESEAGWANLFRTKGLHPKEAFAAKKNWIASGIKDAHSVYQWMDNGFSVKTAATWFKSGFDNPFLAFNYKRAGFGPREAAQWLNAVSDSNRAKHWKRAGFSPVEAKRWYALGYSPDEARQRIDIAK